MRTWKSVWILTERRPQGEEVALLEDGSYAEIVRTWDKYGNHYSWLDKPGDPIAKPKRHYVSWMGAVNAWNRIQAKKYEASIAS